MLFVSLFSPDGRYDQLYLSNYATIQIRDQLAPLEGVGEVIILGQRDYSMRVWLNPDLLTSRGITARDVARALREQNVQVAAGQIGQQPATKGVDFQYTMSTLGRLTEPEQFANIVVKTGREGQITRLRDLGRVELGAKNEDVRNYLDGMPSAGVGVFQLPGANALETADRVKAKMVELKERFPEGLEYAMYYDTTPYIKESIGEVFKTLRDAVLLVALVVLVFLQNWRSALIPLIAVPVAIVGTFAAMAVMGLGLNTLSLFGLVLAIGIVVDDAIVVVEATEHHIEQGMAPRAAAHQAMAEVSGPVIAIGLVLSCVFIPCVFLSGITGRFFRQFALTIAVSTIISTLNSLTLSPALCALLLKPRHAHLDPLSRVLNFFLGWFFRLFNKGFSLSVAGYTFAVGKLLRVSVVVLLVYGGLLYLTTWSLGQMPTGFIPQQDQGFLYVVVQLPDSSSLERTDAAMAHADQIILNTGGVAHVLRICGMSFTMGANGSHLGTMFVILKPFEERRRPGQSADEILKSLNARLAKEVPEAVVTVLPSPPVRGLGSAGGFRLMVEDRENLGLAALQESIDTLVDQGRNRSDLSNLVTVFRAATPQLNLPIDRTKCKTMGLALNDVFDSLQVFLGGLYVNDINLFGRTWQVNVQADAPFRMDPDDVRRLHVRNADGQMIPLSTVTPVQRAGAVLHQPLQHVHRRRRQRRAGQGRQRRRGDGDHGPPGQGELDHLRMDGAVLLAADRRQHDGAGLHRGRGPRVSGPRRPVRKLVAAAGGDLRRADVHPLLGGRRRGGADGRQPLHPDRLRRARGAGEQERDPHRRVRQGEARIGPRPPRGHAGRLQAPPPADLDDLAGLHPRRRAADRLQRRRLRDAPHPGDRRVQRHVGRHPLWHLPHARVLQRHPMVRRPPPGAANEARG